MGKNRIIGLITLFIGIATLIFQIYRLRETGSFYAIGMISSALIVIGIGSFFTDITSFQEDDGFGKQRNKSFGELGGAQKAVIVVGVLAAIGQFAYFKFGAPLL